MPEKTKRQDLRFLLGVAFFLLILCILWRVLYQTPGDTVTIQIDQNDEQTISLDAPQRIEIPFDGQVGNVLVIEDGQAYMSEATCPDHLCVKQGKITHDGQTIVCLPHRVVVKIHRNQEASVDTMTD